ncbi:MAG TPA: DNA-directed RNA polymerase subunit beta' [Bacillota bacterium]|nr:DNA-directed RNA polymerase subunit beta' [Bacillota bacterium]HOK68848.1 DNA-directed RNA polymerase subunit beta' [Bacillota bacterium]HPP85803.1 DNA-directed RNA polymerase subunit beta' [Bacillota bacterium]
MDNIEFESIKIGLASPEMIRSWSHGEVKKPETINYRTLKPERDGLFCERIFGPTKDWECHCGKYKRGIRYKGKICEKCGVEITTSKVRRERMGHVELAAPVSHIWYFRAIPSKMGLLLNLSPKLLEKVLYFAQYIVIDPGEDTQLSKYQLLTEQQYRDYREKYEDDFKAGMGAEAIRELLAEIDLEKEAEDLKKELLTAQGQRKIRAIKRLEVVEAFRLSGNRPEWMILEALPVIPPEIRPMVQLDGGRFATSDLNDLYRRVINRNNRLKRLMELEAPDIIIRNEKRMLQEAVDALIDNGRRGRPVTRPNNRPLKSLSEMLRGKQGRFRQNLLGKRVDYSGRSVIVVGPELKIYQCGLPKEMALELFKPFVMKTLVATGKSTNIKDAKKRVERANAEVWDALDAVIKEHPVLLNRAPTLHRLSIQAFEPILVEGRAIKLHPLVCPAFNADFDGDQMPVHIPLSAEAQAEARFLMLSANNLLKPVNGRAVTVPSQDMVLGAYYLTLDKEGEKGEGKSFRNFDEAVMAYENGIISLHAKINVMIEKEINGVKKRGITTTTLGRLIFNQPIPQDLGFVDRSKPENLFKLEIDFTATKDELGQIVDRCIKLHGNTVTCEVLDKLKELGFKYSTKSAITISVYDMTIPPEKQQLLEEADRKVDVVTDFYKKGLLSNEERSKRVVDIWDDCTKKVAEALQRNLDKYNPINMMAVSGARGSIKQIRQLAGMRGLMASATGKTIEIPIKANFREGMKILEYFTAARGARKGLADTALRTADSGYLTRRLVDVSQDVIVREENCHDTRGLWVRKIVDKLRGGKEEVIEPFEDRLIGRYVIGDVVDPRTGEVIVPDDTMITEEQVAKIIEAGIEKVHIRSIINCKSKHGTCVHCYGADLATGLPVSIGEAVGIIAAQSIGEPGTQLTMRTFHSGGVAGGDITQGLPRVEEIFEARKPKRAAVLSEFDGTVRIEESKKFRQIIVTDKETGEERATSVPLSTKIIVENGAEVEKCQKLTDGTENPNDILRISGLDAVYEYIIKEIQRVYRLQAVEIADKHIEVIARQMTRKVKIESAGDTNLLVGSAVDISEFLAENERIQKYNREHPNETPKMEAECSPMLLGITKASLSTESFLSAASFQETTKVLTEAAIKGKRDPLLGLKENVIIGKLIPAGTGMQMYRNVKVDVGEKYDIVYDGNE